MPNPPNTVEIVRDEEKRKFSLKINGTEINKVKAYASKDEAGRGTELALHISVDTLKLG